MSNRALGLALLLACGPTQPAPPAEAPPAQPSQPAPARPDPPPSVPAAADPAKRVYTAEELDRIGPRPPPEPPLTPEELDLLAADNAALSPEMRVKQAYARRRKILQSPDTPAARQIEALRQAALRGELPLPQLPNQSVQPKQELKLSATQKP